MLARAETDPIEDAFDPHPLAADLVRRGLGPLAIMLLEAGKPLTFVGNQFLVFMHPIVNLFATIPYYAQVVHLLEDRDRVECLILALEAAEENH